MCLDDAQIETLGLRIVRSTVALKSLTIAAHGLQRTILIFPEEGSREMTSAATPSAPGSEQLSPLSPDLRAVMLALHRLDALLAKLIHGQPAEVGESAPLTGMYVSPQGWPVVAAFAMRAQVRRGEQRRARSRRAAPVQRTRPAVWPLRLRSFSVSYRARARARPPLRKTLRLPAGRDAATRNRRSGA